MTPPPDRIEELLKKADLTGIDFVYVYPDQVTLDVYFLWNPGKHQPPTGSPSPLPLIGNLEPADIRIYNPAGEAPDIHVNGLSWETTVDGRDVARLHVAHAGDFTRYKLRIDDLRVDAYYNDVFFTFKANCPSDLDCAPADPECPPDEPVDFPVDYSARDFWSFRRALLDFAALRYPDWPDRLAADAGVMLAEVMSAVGDEMAYYQDRIGREAYLETATQRRSIRRHARLVDYTVHEGRGGSGWLDITVEAGAAAIPAGTDVWAEGDNQTRVDFEIGRGLFDQRASYPIAFARNFFEPHIRDEADACLPVGTTDLYVQNHQAAVLTPFDDFAPGRKPGRWVLLKTEPPNAAQPARTQLVRLIAVTDEHDAALDADMTHLVWETDQALPVEFDQTCLTVRGNLVPVTAGKRYTTYFIIGDELNQLADDQKTELVRVATLAGNSGVDQAVERAGHDESITYLMTLPLSEEQPLVWLGNDLRLARPEVRLTSQVWNVNRWVPDQEWTWRESLLGINSPQSQSTDFTLDDGSWRRVVGYQRQGEEFVHRDYATNGGKTIRFGDGDFGLTPAQQTVFRVDYRLGGDRRGNVPAESLRFIDPSWQPVGFTILSVSNPLPVADGVDAETPGEVRQLAPDAFRAQTFRAVRPEDYAEAAERLDWVQRAGSSFRWTGSWLSAFTTPDPRGAVTLSETHRQQVVDQLNRFRQAGRESHVSNPIYASLDLVIDVCAEVSVYRGELRERILEVLLGKTGVRSRSGYFSPNYFTFGTRLERSTLEAIIQRIPGVRAVEGIRFRRRGWFDWKSFNAFSYDPGGNAIIRVANDPLHPERGTLKLSIHGGA